MSRSTQLQFFKDYISFEEVPLSLQEIEAQEVWQHIYDKKIIFNKKYGTCVSQIYHDGIEILNLNRNCIPTLSDFNSLLNPYGWQAVWIPGYVPGHIYSGLIANKCFPIAKNIRKLSHLDYSPIPDFIHDVYGHLPLIFDNNYSSFLIAISQQLAQAQDNEFDQRLYLAQKNIAELQALDTDPHTERYIKADLEFQDAIALSNQYPSEKTYLSRMFLWTIEFGLIGDKNNFKIIGAGILSSFEEGLCALNGLITIKAFDSDNTQYGFDYFSEKQKFLFVATSVDEYLQILKHYKACKVLDLQVELK